MVSAGGANPGDTVSAGEKTRMVMRVPRDPARDQVREWGTGCGPRTCRLFYTHSTVGVGARPCAHHYISFGLLHLIYFKKKQQQKKVDYLKRPKLHSFHLQFQSRCYSLFAFIKVQDKYSKLSASLLRPAADAESSQMRSSRPPEVFRFN